MSKEVRSQSGRFRVVVLRFLVPLLCLAGLLAFLGILYRGFPAPDADPVASIPAASAPAALNYEQLKPQYMQMVTTGLKKLEGFSGTKYRGHPDAVKAELMVFQAWALLQDVDGEFQSDQEGRHSPGRKPHLLAGKKLRNRELAGVTPRE